MTIAGSPKLERMAQNADARRREALNERIERSRTLTRLASEAGHDSLANHYYWATVSLIEKNL